MAPAVSADYSKLTVPIIKYRGGNYKPREEAVRSLMSQLARRTSIEVSREPIEIEITDPNLYRYPFIYLSGDGAFEPFSEKELRTLRHYLGFGGFLLIDDNSSKVNSEFDASVRKMISRLFPKIPLQKISRDHSIYRSFYLINRPAGRIVLNPFLEGISVKDGRFWFIPPMTLAEPGPGISWDTGTTTSSPAATRKDKGVSGWVSTSLCIP